ncbi:aminotransferase class I/II-fold pyridoxal phosphate-dependent enzyme [Microbacterium sp. BG28]|uniref:MalY/PatB family protein n=1 Tax=Microbacterium sp. BG28 TaxID=3097356 RepID=UPI002A59F8D7|nr:aminotransferase class I/II-fold pyridoxal phosphate-dependent enzyme [Microbacterium sp. BG28]MDY0830090.1 aminotransferase class I/II-fold pyridoxal phosphate-dependent enzyme [Microbacterium sp. BG28]
MTHPYDERGRERLDRPESRKWSLHPGKIGAWVAEMDFGTAPVVSAALHRAVEEETLGYLSPALAERMAAATAGWMRRAYGWSVASERVHPVADVMAALGVAVRTFAPAGSPVIVPTPAYMPFLTYLPAIGHPVIPVPGRVVSGRWEHDIEGIDAAFSAGARTLVLCNPHNPTGSVLTREELTRIAEVVERHGGRVFADEIHAPLRYGGVAHVPYASLSEATAAHTVTGTSASKAWNIPGVKAAQLITSNQNDDDIYRRVGFAHVHGASTLGVVASIAAYDEGGSWLAQTIEYLDGNRMLLVALLAEHLPEVRYTPPEGTYLAWLDGRGLALPAAPADFFRERAGVVLTDGALCAAPGFLRLVLAMPRPLLADAVAAMGASARE